MASDRFSEMDPAVCDDGTANIKYNYLAITVIPKIQDNFVAMTGAQKMTFTVGTYAWGNYYSFAKPVIPTAATLATDPDQAGYLSVSFGLSVLII